MRLAGSSSRSADRQICWVKSCRLVQAQPRSRRSSPVSRLDLEGRAGLAVRDHKDAGGVCCQRLTLTTIERDGTGRNDALQAGVYGISWFGPAYLAGALSFSNHWFADLRGTATLRYSWRERSTLNLRSRLLAQIGSRAMSELCLKCATQRTSTRSGRRKFFIGECRFDNSVCRVAKRRSRICTSALSSHFRPHFIRGRSSKTPQLLRDKLLCIENRRGLLERGLGIVGHLFNRTVLISEIV